MDLPLVSIVIPVFNAARTLPRCVRSLLGQTYSRIELIFVDDGSQDASATLCDTYARENERVRVVHQKNAGPSAARNAGLALANGKYLQFVDADDWVEPDMTACCVAAMEQSGCSFVLSPILCHGERETTVKDRMPHKIGVQPMETVLRCISEYPCDVYFGSPDNKLYLTETAQKYARFPEGSIAAEDYVFNLMYWQHSCKAYILEKAFYHYQMDTPHSLTKRAKPYDEDMRAKLAIYEELQKAFAVHGAVAQYKAQLNGAYLFFVWWALLACSSQELKQCWSAVQTLLRSERTQEAAACCVSALWKVRMFARVVRFRQFWVVRLAVRLKSLQHHAAQKG